MGLINEKKIWSGIIKEIIMKSDSEKKQINPYILTLEFREIEKNAYQVIMLTKKMGLKDNISAEYATIYCNEDGIIKGCDINGVIDGRIIGGNKKRKMEFFYRSFKNEGLIVSYFGELEEDVEESF